MRLSSWTVYALAESETACTVRMELELLDAVVSGALDGMFDDDGRLHDSKRIGTMMIDIRAIGKRMIPWYELDLPRFGGHNESTSWIV